MITDAKFKMYVLKMLMYIMEMLIFPNQIDTRPIQSFINDVRQEMWDNK